jgi:uncharacterized protein YcaQ
MLKSYELMERHFVWEGKPKPASERQIIDYLVDRALRAQGLVSLDSICHLDAKRKGAVRATIEARVRRGELVPVTVEAAQNVEHWATPETLEPFLPRDPERPHILSPFDPLIIQRKRLKMFFDYEHRFEAYLPKERRVMGYFALPVIVGDAVVAAIDLKADRVKRTLLIQQWTWIGKGARRHKARIEEELQRFEQFQVKS